jgi:hypothetical protein
MKITGLDLVCAITRRCHFFALAVGFVNPSSQLASLIGHAQHRTHTHPELARNAADTVPLARAATIAATLVSVGILANAVAVLRPSVRPGKQPMIVMTGAVAARRHPGVR